MTDSRKRTRSRMARVGFSLSLLLVLGACALGGGGTLAGAGLAAAGPAFAGLDADLKEIPAGSFRMGDLGATGWEEPTPVHEVHLRAFRLARHDLTFEQFDTYARATGAPLPDDAGWGRGNRPVVNITWNEAQAFIAWLDARTGRHFRLPSEAEWEYAARAGTKTLYPWGDADDPSRRNGVGSVGRTTPVGSYPPNAWGLYDMIGNSWQWIEDCWHDRYTGAPADGSAWEEAACPRRVMRGGSWDNDPTWLRVADRASFGVEERMDGVGLRLAEDSAP